MTFYGVLGDGELGGNVSIGTAGENFADKFELARSQPEFRIRALDAGACPLGEYVAFHPQLAFMNAANCLGKDGARHL